VGLSICVGCVACKPWFSGAATNRGQTRAEKAENSRNRQPAYRQWALRFPRHRSFLFVQQPRGDVMNTEVRTTYSSYRVFLCSCVVKNCIQTTDARFREYDSNHIHSQTLPWSRFSPKILHLALACIRRHRRCNSLYHGFRIQTKDYRFVRSSSEAGSCHVHVHSIGYHIPLLISLSTVLHDSM